MNYKNEVTIIGAGLAGCEAAYQLINRGFKVRLFEMRPKKLTEAHQTGNFAELICSNSFRAASIENAIGLLKEEMRILGSLTMKAADYSRVEAGGALAVDRNIFSTFITEYLKHHESVAFVNEEVTEIPAGPTIIASGPLTSPSLSNAIKLFCGEEYLYFFDAIAPIITEESIDKSKAYLKSRYDKGEASYYNCPMNEEEFNRFYDALIQADRVLPHGFEMKVFEGCMAIEDIAARGRETLLFGPMKPVGLTDPGTGKIPYAVVQLRQDDAAKSVYNIVGFQTHLKFPDQKQIIRMIPGLEKAEIVRYGVMHRNTFINSPKVLNHFYQAKDRKDLFFAGQITGVEGYIESASSGMVAGINMAKYLNNQKMIDFTRNTAIGSLANYISIANKDFQPMNVNHGLFALLEGRIKKADRKNRYASRSFDYLRTILGEVNP